MHDVINPFNAAVNVKNWSSLIKVCPKFLKYFQIIHSYKVSICSMEGWSIKLVDLDAINRLID